MAKRKSSFIGSSEWVKKDVFIEDEGEVTVVADVPSGISITFRSTVSRSEMLAALAHRVKQLA